MRSFTILRAATLALGIGLVGAAGTSGAFAQDQYQRYDYARDVAPHIQAQLQNQANLAAAQSTIRSDANQSFLPGSSTPGHYSPEAVLNQEGANAW